MDELEAENFYLKFEYSKIKDTLVSYNDQLNDLKNTLEGVI